MSIQFLPAFVRESYECHEWRHACAVMREDFPNEWAELIEVLEAFRLKRSEVQAAGKNKSPISRGVDGQLYKRGWVEKKFDTKIVIDGHELISPTHKVDCYKNKIAVEIEWNNKDPFFDRDLNNFRLLFDLRAISVGVIITRRTELQLIFNELGKGTSYGNSTTHMDKLLPRIAGGGGGGCPLLAFGISRRLYVED